jgi:hypothetical protein
MKGTRFGRNFQQKTSYCGAQDQPWYTSIWDRNVSAKEHRQVGKAQAIVLHATHPSAARSLSEGLRHASGVLMM